MTSQKLFKLKCNDRDYYLMTTEVNEVFELVLTDAKNAWKGKVCQLSAKNIQTDITDYLTQTRNALCGDSIDNFEYELKGNINGKETVQLIWKKVIEKDSVKFQLGSTTLEPCENLSIIVSKAFDHLLDISNDLRQQMAELRLNQDKLTEERNAALKKLENCATIKEDTESSLYSKFTDVLNEKKAKIRSLTTQLKQSSTNSANQDNRMEVSNDSRDEAEVSDRDYNTDEEKQKKTRPVDNCTTTMSSKKAADDAKRNRTSSSGSHSPMSLMLEDRDSNDDELPVVAKRGKKTADDDVPKNSETANSNEDESKDESKKSKYQRIPCMLSWTGTTNTSTTSSDRQRHLEIPASKSKAKETPKETVSPRTSEIATVRSADVDDLIGDMA